MINPIAIAPMIDWTNKHFRYFMRLITPHSLLYTEMITTGAIIHGNRSRLLAYNPEEHPVALQLGGSDPKQLAECAKVGEGYGYDEINLNVGCPSERVQSGSFGACLMAEPELLSDCVAAMRAKVQIPVTVKTRIGIDDKDSYEELHRFVEIISRAGCEHFIIHARKAWLKGLSPKENRTIPPLHYDRVFRLKKDFPHLFISINGGITSVEKIHELLKHCDGVMLGRAAYQNPFLFHEIENSVLKTPIDQLRTRKEIMLAYLPYIASELSKGIRLTNLIKPMMGLFKGEVGARSWRQVITQQVKQPEKFVETLLSVIDSKTAMGELK